MTKEYLIEKYEKLKSEARHAIEDKDYRYAIDCIAALSYIAYTFGLRYADDEVENMLASLAQIITKKYNSIRNEGSHHKCVFIDSLSSYHGGLTVQYLRAIKAASWDVLYVSEANLWEPRRAELRQELESNSRLQYVCVPRKKKGIERSIYIYETIMDFQPENVFIHISPYSAYPAVACYALPKNIKKYWIDYTDHSFHLGTGCVDYSFEFRNIGASISARYRHLSKTQLIKLPFYSFMDDEDFKGLPSVCDGKTVILSGGNYWKIMDEEGTFFRIVKTILDECTNTIIIYAGAGNEKAVKKFLRKYDIDERFVLIGWRKDISALFEHCDIFLCTYPVGGGLMSQFAARAAKPILAYDPNEGKETESLLCQKKNLDVSIENMADFIKEAKRLVSDIDYRRKRGKEMAECVLSINDFNAIFKKAVIEDEPTGLPIIFDENVAPKSDEYINNNILVQTEGHNFESSMFFFLKKNTSRVFPFYYIWYGVMSIISKKVKTFIQRINI